MIPKFVVEVGEVVGVQVVDVPVRKPKIVVDIAQAMQDNYVFADIGAECAELIRTKLKAGEYDDLEPVVLAQTINDQLMDITHDLHFGVRFEEPGARTGGGGGGGGGMRPANHGFKTIETLSGNIGYIDFRMFDNSIGARKTTDAAMAFLRNSDAIRRIPASSR